MRLFTEVKSIHRKYKILIFIVVIVVLGIFGFSHSCNLAIATGIGIKSVSLGEEFRIGKGELVKVKGKRVALKITGFDNQPCPIEISCTNSGQTVYYELTVDGKKYNDDLMTPYRLIINSNTTNFTSFAYITINYIE